MGCDLAKLVTLNFGFENGALTESENMALKHSESLFVDERKRKKNTSSEYFINCAALDLQ